MDDDQRRNRSWKKWPRAMCKCGQIRVSSRYGDFSDEAPCEKCGTVPKQYVYPSDERSRADTGGEPVRELEELLKRCVDALDTLPQDCLGDGVVGFTAPDTGETAEMRWPIRDELIDDINRALAASGTQTEASTDEA